MIHPDKSVPFEEPNTTRWIAYPNDLDFCLVFADDSRVTIIQVEPIDDASV